ncbi:T3SS effector OspC family protein [Escherichia albertii]|uniref:T3SS effector OspC family protein n=1 Tax=Escherichia albertii TaxID=208962 RepID=UPI0010F9103F|nr:T3SS effector OspC family protein [Escherichia albertii]
MKVPDSLSGIIQNNIGIINKDIYQNNDKSSSYKNISFVELLPTFRPGETIILDNSSNIIKNFFRKTIAAQSYSKMFSQGTIFKSLNFSLNAPSGERASFQSLAHLNKVSKHYLSEIRKKVTPLSSDERYLLSIIVNSKFNFRHQSNSNLSNGSLNIKSYSKIQSESLCTNKNTYSDDIKKIANHDFVFFGVEISNHKEKIPLNTKHHAVDFGANAYITDVESPYGYMTLTDHFDNIIPYSFCHEYESFFSKNFKEVLYEVRRYVHGNNGRNDVPIFTTKDMRLGLGLHLIDFIRQSKDELFKEFCYNKNIDPVSLDRIINFVFQPEYHIPRMLSTENFQKIKLREMSLEEAVKASNYEEINEQVTDKKAAHKALLSAIENAKDDVAFYILSRFKYSKQDIVEMNNISNDDVEYSLSRTGASPGILEFFIVNGLIDVNKKFTKVNEGDTMLDNADKFKDQSPECKKIFDLLLTYGAVSGKNI